jgi:hypothetical protein
VNDLPFGGTDCALPTLYALAYDREADAFVIVTDNETWAGDIHPVHALVEYRRASGIDARLVTVGMVSNGFTIPDPNDPGQPDVVRFTPDAAAGRGHRPAPRLRGRREASSSQRESDADPRSVSGPYPDKRSAKVILRVRRGPEGRSVAKQAHRAGHDDKRTCK